MLLVAGALLLAAGSWLASLAGALLSTGDPESGVLSRWMTALMVGAVATTFVAIGVRALRPSARPLIWWGGGALLVATMAGLGAWAWPR